LRRGIEIYTTTGRKSWRVALGVDNDTAGANWRQTVVVVAALSVLGWVGMEGFRNGKKVKKAIKA
jgi:hypothetical protein